MTYPPYTDARSRLIRDGFIEIGRFEIAERAFNYVLDLPEARGWTLSLYAWVSIPSDTVLRIGKCEGRLETRIAAFKRSLDDAMGSRLGPNECFKGNTMPRELDGWVASCAMPGAGRIFARRLLGQLPEGEAPKAALHRMRRELIAAYDPPLCNDSVAGRRRQRAWDAKNGPIVRRRKRLIVKEAVFT